MIVDALPELRGRVSVVHNWVDVEAYRRRGSPDGPDYRAAWGLGGSTVAVFAGVMGPSQRLALLLDLASALRDESGLLFLLVGNGSERPALERRAAEAGLDNVRFEDFVSPDDYPALLRAAKLGVVCLSADNTTPVVPAKLLGYMAGRPAGVGLAARQLRRACDDRRGALWRQRRVGRLRTLPCGHARAAGVSRGVAEDGRARSALR